MPNYVIQDIQAMVIRKAIVIVLAFIGSWYSL